MSIRWEERNDFEFFDEGLVLEIQDNLSGWDFRYWHINQQGRPYTVSIPTLVVASSGMPTTAAEGHISIIDLMQDAMDLMKEVVR